MKSFVVALFYRSEMLVKLSTIEPGSLSAISIMRSKSGRDLYVQDKVGMITASEFKTVLRIEVFGID